MKRITFLALLVAASALSQAYSFGGDWTFQSDATLNYNTNIASGSQNSLTNSLVTVTQSTTDAFAFPISFSGITGQGDFIVSGNTVTDINSSQTTDPFNVLLGATIVSVRLTYPTWNLTGTVDGIDSSNGNAFGDYAYHITGNATTINNVQLEAFMFGSWQNLGTNNSIVIDSWSLERDAVPEPATLTILAIGVAATFKKRKQS